MTRKERIDQASAINAAYVGEFGIVGRLTKEKMLTYQNGFIRGAEWSDENPKNQWISVDDYLPCNNGAFMDWAFKNCTRQMLVKCKDGVVHLERMANLQGKWQWRGLNDDITHWMPIPEFKED